MKLTSEQRSYVEDANYAMFEPLGNLMVGQFLLTLLEKYYITPDHDIEALGDIASEVSKEYPESEASDTAVQDAIISVIQNVVAQQVH